MWRWAIWSHATNPNWGILIINHCRIANVMYQNQVEDFDLNVFLLEDKTRAHVKVGAPIFVGTLKLVTPAPSDASPIFILLIFFSAEDKIVLSYFFLCFSLINTPFLVSLIYFSVLVHSFYQLCLFLSSIVNPYFESSSIF